jgi:hypothetical protein
MVRTAHVQLVLATDVVSWKDASRVTRALRKQARDHFAPVYGLCAEVELVPRGRQDPSAWQIAVVDDARSADDDGWHELTAGGRPLGKVLAGQVLRETGGWSSTASHELLELLADPDMSLTVVAYDRRGSHLYAYEICDPVQDDRHGYFIDRERVSNFVYPAWFESFHARGAARFDHRGACDRPLQVVSGGYASVTHAHWERGWRDVGPSRGKPGRSHGTRRGRRRAARASWRRSEA